MDEKSKPKHEDDGNAANDGAMLAILMLSPLIVFFILWISVDESGSIWVGLLTIVAFVACAIVLSILSIAFTRLDIWLRNLLSRFRARDATITPITLSVAKRTYTLTDDGEIMEVVDDEKPKRDSTTSAVK